MERNKKHFLNPKEKSRDQKRRRRSLKRRSNACPSQAVLNTRMRELWIDGYGLLPQGATDLQVSRTRIALRSLVEDDTYWAGLRSLSDAKQQVNKLMAELKGGRHAS